MGSSKHRLNRLLVIAEVTLASVLLIGAGLVTKGFIRLLDTHPGFRKDNVLTMNFSLSGERYKEGPGRRAFYQQLLSRLLAIPGVRSAGLISDIPLSTGSNSVRNFKIENRPVQAPGEVLMENFQLTSPQYLEALSIPLKRGRFFSESDNENAPPVVVINASMAKKHWNLQDPIGKRIQLEGKWRTIVGIIGNVQLLDLQESSRPQMFLPYRQYSEGNLGLVVHTVRDPLSIVSAVRQEVHSLDPLQPITRIRTMKKVISDQYATRQFLMVLMAIFAAVALLLAIVGLYSVMAYSVSQRTREIGVRMALGARQADVSKAVLRRGLLLVAVGTGLGLIIALAVMRSISSLLLGVSPADPPVFVGVSLLLAVVALTACYIPAHQATQVNPVVALRYE
jgi:putative ABC transport system permease protein